MIFFWHIYILFSFWLKLLLGQATSEKAPDKILIKSPYNCNEIDKITDPLIIIDESKKDIVRTITSCFEKPIDQMLEKWSTDLEKEGPSRHKSKVIAEIKAIRKQLTLNESNRVTAVSDLPKGKTRVPGDIKDYLFGWVFHISLGTKLIFKMILPLCFCFLFLVPSNNRSIYKVNYISKHSWILHCFHIIISLHVVEQGYIWTILRLILIVIYKFVTLSNCLKSDQKPSVEIDDNAIKSGRTLLTHRDIITGKL